MGMTIDKALDEFRESLKFENHCFNCVHKTEGEWMCCLFGKKIDCHKARSVRGFKNCIHWENKIDFV